MSPSDKNDKAPSRTQVLLDNYRESRQEGIKLAHSVFSDIAFAAALLGTILTGGAIANVPVLLLLIPFLIGGIGIYLVQKFRANNLITSYMIYLEKEINKEYSSPVMIWNSEFIRRNISFGRQSVWGGVLVVFAIVIIGVIYGFVCYWPITQNQVVFDQNRLYLYLYIGGCALVFLFDIVGVLGIMSVTRKYTPDYINSLVKSRKIEYSGKTERRNPE